MNFFIMPAAVTGLAILSIFYLWFGWPQAIKHETKNLQINYSKTVPQKKINYQPIKIQAVSAVAFEAQSKARIFDQNGEEVRPIASLTKLMTAMVFLETKPDWNKDITIIDEDLQTGAKANIFSGDKINLKDLFTTALVASDNSAITALVRSTGLSKQQFVDLMNLKAKQLHLSNMKFSDPTGLDKNNQGTAVDVAKLAEAAFKHQEITAALKLYTYRFKVSQKVTRRVVSTDQLIGLSLPMGAKMLLGKTGHLDEAGYCFVGVFQYQDRKIITAVLGASENENRFSETIKILDWTLRAYLWDNNNIKP